MRSCLKFTRVGDFCLNSGYARTYRGNLIRFGFSRQGRQRFHCKTYQSDLQPEPRFYGKHYWEADILETLALLAEGSRLRVPFARQGRPKVAPAAVRFARRWR